MCLSEQGTGERRRVGRRPANVATFIEQPGLRRDDWD